MEFPLRIGFRVFLWFRVYGLGSGGVAPVFIALWGLGLGAIAVQDWSQTMEGVGSPCLHAPYVKQNA